MRFVWTWLQGSFGEKHIIFVIKAHKYADYWHFYSLFLPSLNLKQAAKCSKIVPPGAGIWSHLGAKTCRGGAGIRRGGAGIRRGGAGIRRGGAGIRRVGYPGRRIPAPPLHVPAPPLRIPAPPLRLPAPRLRQILAPGGTILVHLAACLE